MASHENQTPEAAAEQRKKVAAGALFALLLFVLWWQDPFGLFTSEEVATTPAATAQAKSSPTPRAAPSPGRDQVITEPIHPEAIAYKATPLDGIGRNIFVYPTPTPPPTPKPQSPPPPAPTPPIILIGLNPAGVIGRTGGFDLTVTGVKFPNDSRVFLDGREIQTTFLDESHLQGKVLGEMVNNPGNLGVQVRSVGDPKLFSNQASLNVAEPPPPPYRYVGLIVGKQGAVAVLKSQIDDDVINVKKGDVIGKPKRWEIVSISSTRIEIMDTQIKVGHSLAFTSDGGT